MVIGCSLNLCDLLLSGVVIGYSLNFRDWLTLQMSCLTVGCVDSYKDGIDRTCDSVDASIKVTNLNIFVS